MSFISNFISPKLGVKLIRSQLEKQFKKSIPDFDIVFIASTNKLDIVIDGIFYPFAADQLKDIILSTSKKQLKAFQQMDIVSVNVNAKDEINITMAYTEGREKKKITYKL